ncbi:MAG: S-methyl-5'-thioadenosine phosphorylase, partial [Nitrospira sp.]|nr:S-methyl-5'-thioadenosine phosphorylase [Nitrospira sp.]
HRNVALAKRILQAVLPSVADTQDCACHQTLTHAVITDRKQVPAAAKRKLALLTRRVWAPMKGAR